MTPEEFTFDTNFDFGMDEFSFDDDSKDRDNDQDFEDIEGQAKGELSELLMKFKERAKQEEAEKAKNISTDYWFAVYFATQEDRDKFLNLFNLVEKMQSQYIDGQTFVDQLGVEMQLSKITPPKPFRKPKGIEDLILD